MKKSQLLIILWGRSGNMPRSFFNQFKFVLTESELKQIKKLNISFNSTIILIYLLNQNKPKLNIDELIKMFDLNESEIMISFNDLISQKIIDVKMSKNGDKKIEELIILDPFYQKIESEFNDHDKEAKTKSVFNSFESEFGRTLSPMEFELIDGWLKSGINEELLIGALKEATFNGVKNFRYIDKIIFEWNKKGYKTVDDIKKDLIRNPKQDEKKELFDYNWLDDDQK